MPVDLPESCNKGDDKMKIEVYEEKEKKGEEKIVRLKLVNRADSYIALEAVNEDGSVSGRILRIAPDGVRRFRGCGDMGFPTDSKGRVVLDE